MASCTVMQCIKYLVVFMFLSQMTCSGYRILGLFPHPGISHFHFFHPIMRELADAGHNVTVVSHFPDARAPKNYKDLPLSGMETLTNAVDLDWFANRNKFVGHFLEFFLLKNWGDQACQNTVNSTAIKKVLAMKHPFDVIIVEQFNTDCMMGIAWKLQAPVIGLSSCALLPWHYDRVGNPHLPSHVPALFMGYSDNMSYSARLANWLTVHGMKLLYRHFADPAADRILKEAFGDTVPSVTELSKKTSMLFVNQHYSLSGVKPLSPAVVELGGIHIKEAKPLDEKLQKLLDNAEHGVIYVSWGSMIRAETLPSEKREELLKAFSLFKQKIIWKWENETLPNQPANVFIQKWLPQRDILCHPKVRVFVTHGGLMGSSEAAHCGVPVVVTPMYGDQFLNAAALVARGMGKIVHYEDISRDSIANAIRFALDSTTQDNARKVSHSYRNRLQTPQKTAVWWVEHVAATGGVPLTRSHSTYMPAYSYYSFDVYATLTVAVLVCVGSWVWVLKRFCGKRSKLPSSPKLKSH